MKLLAFGASTSASSINRIFANYAARSVEGAEVTDLDLNTFDLPIFSEDEEAANGIPPSAHRFKELIESHDGIVISMAEHNGSYTAAFKNLYDWSSRVDYQVWADKPMLLLATSPGGRGGQTVLEAAAATFPRMGANLLGTFSLPSFQENFAEADGIKDGELAAEFGRAVEAFADVWK